MSEMKSKSKFCNIYLLSWVIYYLQNYFDYRGSFLSRALILILLMVSFYYTIYAINHFKLPKPMKILGVMLAIWTVYGLIMIILQDNSTAPSFNYIKDIYISFLPIYTIYVFVKKGWLTEKMLLLWTYVFVVIGVMLFYSNARARMDLLGTDEVTNNSGYAVVTIIPLLLLFKDKPIIQYVLLGVCMFHVIIGMKRGAILCGAVCTLWLVLSNMTQEKKLTSKAARNMFWRLLLTVGMIVGGIIVVTNLFATSDYFNHRFEQTMDGDTSGRDELYSMMLDYYLNQDFWKVLVGNGGYSTESIFGVLAHNDWLEIAIDNGLILLVVYAAFWISMIVMFLKGDKTKERIMLGMFLLIYLFKSFVSMSYSAVTIYSACYIGLAFANYEFKSKKVSIK